LIREVRVEDAETIATLFTEFNAILGADGYADEEALRPERVLVTAAQMKARLDAIAAIEPSLMANLDGEPAGFLCLRLVPYAGQDAPYAEVTQLYVRPALKRRGVGAALIAEAERLAVAAGATCVHIITGAANLDAQAFYRAQGYAMPGVEFEKHFSPEVAHA
jgi:ribosomal protein S18 acetylase RimI-like enzyme